MRIAGIIFLVLGFITLIPVFVTGSSIWAPVFWLVLGTIFINVKKKKKEDTNTENTPQS